MFKPKMPIITKFFVLNSAAPGGAPGGPAVGVNNDDTIDVGYIQNVKRIIFKSCLVDLTAPSGGRHYIRTSLVNDICGIFSGCDNIQFPQKDIIYDLSHPTSFQGVYDFKVVDIAGTTTPITGNILIHAEFHV